MILFNTLYTIPGTEEKTKKSGKRTSKGMSEEMTGKEAWELIRNHISPMLHEEFNNKRMSQAFITTYIALKEFDERNKQNAKLDVRNASDQRQAK